MWEFLLLLVEFLSIPDIAVAFLMFRTWNSIIVAISNPCFNMETNFGVGELSIVLFCWAFHLPQCIATVLRRKVNVTFPASISGSWAFGHRDVRFRLESSHSHPIVVTFFSHRCFCFVFFRVSVSKSAKKKTEFDGRIEGWNVSLKERVEAHCFQSNHSAASVRHSLPWLLRLLLHLSHYLASHEAHPRSSKTKHKIFQITCKKCFKQAKLKTSSLFQRLF